MRVAVLTLSDSGWAGKREDKSGPLIASVMEQAGWKVVHTAILPDNQEMLTEKLKRLCDEHLADLILTTGGTGFSPTDITPEATAAVIERPTPGIPEAMRLNSLRITPRAMLSRSVAGIRKQSLIINLPGSPKAVKECLDLIMPALPHGLEILTGTAHDCARS